MDNKGYLKCIRKRDRLNYKVKKNPAKTSLKVILVKYNRTLQKMLKNVKYKYFHKVFQENRNNTKHMWSTINNYLGNRKNGSQSAFVNYINIERDGGTISTITGDMNIANNINEHFTRGSVKPRHENYKNDIKSCTKSLFLYKTDEVEVNRDDRDDRDSLHDIMIRNNILNIFQLHVNEVIKIFLLAKAERSETFSVQLFEVYDNIECIYDLRKSSTICIRVPKYNNDYRNRNNRNNIYSV